MSKGEQLQKQLEEAYFTSSEIDSLIDEYVDNLREEYMASEAKQPRALLRAVKLLLDAFEIRAKIDKEIGHLLDERS